MTGASCDPGVLSSLLIFLSFVLALVVVWTMLVDWAFQKVDPWLKRLLWRLVGGTGDPPTDDEAQ